MFQKVKEFLSKEIDSNNHFFEKLNKKTDTNQSWRYLGLEVEEIILEKRGEWQLIQVDRRPLVDTIVDLHATHLLQRPRPAKYRKILYTTSQLIPS